MKLNLGCGPLSLPGEIGVDKYPTSAAEVIADIRALPYANNTAEFARLDHVLEHLPVRDAVPVLLEAYRVLEPGGRIRVGVPDLAATCRAYINAPNLADCANIQRQLYGSQTHEGEYHMSGWDKATLADLVQSVGFAGVVVVDDPERDEGICIVATGVKPCG